MTNRSKKIWNGNVRDAALSILMEINKNQAYSNLLLHRTIEKYNIEAKDRGLLTELTYGTLQHRMTLDFYLKPYVRSKLDDWVRELLRMSIYQIVYLTKIPPHAVVNEAVNIAKRRGHKRIAPTVNGILRSILREGVPTIEEITNPVERISIETSHPKWLIERWMKQFGEEETIAMAHENNYPAMMTVRVNTTKATVEHVQKMLEEDGLIVYPSDLIKECLKIESGNPSQTVAFKEGFITIQDESSMLPAHALQLEEPMKVLDMCAAPGGKTTHIAELMDDKGEVIAYDIHPHKIKLINNNAERLGLSSIAAHAGDSRELLETYGEQSFDRILVDAPCSGFGVIRRKPEIKYTKKAEEIVGLLPIQEKLLATAATLIKPNGIIVYSTCTTEYDENQGMVKRFLQSEPTMKLLPLDDLQKNNLLLIENNTLQVLPQHFGGDGFFVAAFQKMPSD